MSELRIMSNNLWWNDINNDAWKQKGYDCSAQVRTKGFCKVYKELLPDIIGLQECSGFMRKLFNKEFLEDSLPYELIYGKDTPILVNKNKFTIIETASFLYSETVPGYEGSFNNCSTKSYSIVVLKENESGKTLIFATTHLWWKSSDKNHIDYQPFSNEARTYQLNLLLDKVDEFIDKYDSTAIVVGDLNSVYKSEAISSAVSRGYNDAYFLCNGAKDEGSGMHMCCAKGFDTNCNNGTFEDSIDHILIKGKDVTVKNFIRFDKEYYMPLSDHLPLYIDIKF